QWWMAENLNATKYRNGEEILHVSDLSNPEAWTALTSGAYCYSYNDANNAATYGALYNWYTVGDARGLAPEGWHVPTDNEWKELEMFLGMSQIDADKTGYRGNEEGKKLRSQSGWFNNGTDEVAFRAMPGGFKTDDSANFGSLGYTGYFWSSTEDGTDKAWERIIFESNAPFRNADSKLHGFSVRCVKDSETAMITASEDSLQFAELKIGNSDTLQFTLYNNSSWADLVISDITNTLASYSVSTTSATIAPQDSLEIEVYFTPTDWGIYNDSLIISSDATGESQIEVYVSGSSVGNLFTVKTTGSDNNLGSDSEPFASIQHAIDQTLDGDTVLVYQGTYIENINFNGKNIVLGSQFLTTQDTSYISSTIIDGNQNGSVVTFESNEDSTTLMTGFTLTNGLNSNGGGICIINSSPHLDHLFIQYNQNPDAYGGGIYSNNSNVILENCIVTSNTVTGIGGGAAFFGGSPSIRNNIFISNYASDSGGALYFRECTGFLANNTLINNEVENNGAGIYTYSSPTPVVYNSIIWANTGLNQIENLNGNISIDYSVVQNGYLGLYNIDSDPQFIDPNNGNFRLSDTSPCIGTGTDSVQIDGTWYFAPITDIDGNPRPNPAGSNPDMGAYESTIGVQPVLIAVSVDTLDFGTLGTGTKDSLELIIFNESYGSDLVVSGITNSNSSFSVNIASATISTRDSLKILITFDPASTGTYTDSLIIVSNDPNKGTVYVVLEGSASTDTSGYIATNTTWSKANSPYYVSGNILVGSGATLTIEPGVTVQIADGMYIKIEGGLIAEGTVNDSIRFTHAENGLFNKIELANTASASFDYFVIEYAEYGIYADAVTPSIQNGRFSHCSVYGLYEYSSGIGTNITNCKFDNNGSGLFYSNRSDFVIENNDFLHNTQYGIYLQYGMNGTIQNNTINGNGNKGIITSFHNY
ncbi:choice-of-anchor D domain-containing protein, partial [bacterium]|nr:choice-of-anchor D domain-containing protein [bacterium]